MPKADYEGVVSSVAVPSYDLPDKKPYFVFGMEKPTISPPDAKPGTAVFYVALENIYGKDIMSLVLTAYQLGVDVQVGLIPDSGQKMLVSWVQLPRSPVVKPKS